MLVSGFAGRFLYNFIYQFARRFLQSFHKNPRLRICKLPQHVFFRRNLFVAAVINSNPQSCEFFCSQCINYILCAFMPSGGGASGKSVSSERQVDFVVTTIIFSSFTL